MENIKDGTAEFRVTDDRLFSILDLIQPVGRIIISNDSTAPYSDVGFGTWQEVAKGAFIEGADDSHKAGDNIDAGLPNITGRFSGILSHSSFIAEGAFSRSMYDDNHYQGYTPDGGNYASHIQADSFDASLSNPIYGNSDTVQPKVYVSHYWLRVK